MLQHATSSAEYVGRPLGLAELPKPSTAPAGARRPIRGPVAPHASSYIKRSKSAQGHRAPPKPFDVSRVTQIHDRATPTPVPVEESIFARTEVNLGDQSAAASKLKSLTAVKEEGFSSQAIPSNAFRSDALRMEVALNEKLRLAVEPQNRFKVFEETFSAIIAKDQTYGYLLQQIKQEYDSERAPPDENSLKAAYQQLMQQYKTTVYSLQRAQDDNMQLRQQLEISRQKNMDLTQELEVMETMNSANDGHMDHRPPSRAAVSNVGDLDLDDVPLHNQSRPQVQQYSTLPLPQTTAARRNGYDGDTTSRSSYSDDTMDTARGARHGYDDGTRPSPNTLRLQQRPASVPAISLDNCYPDPFTEDEEEEYDQEQEDGSQGASAYTDDLSTFRYDDDRPDNDDDDSSEY
eukprot:CAMPEP_0114558540 /NCGR_PEP_ID=MMETSP0114-20121206/10438_1 /TAXON_ID=31324 /ORGANISM="Goniomonas sp, Strain m" /LENGTH=404 /DNA_ID=CAMNT_0001743941 /DNA_START=239 /DNA_END=1453 /DNA_ORIENTATION=+